MDNKSSPSPGALIEIVVGIFSKSVIIRQKAFRMDPSDHESFKIHINMDPIDHYRFKIGFKRDPSDHYPFTAGFNMEPYDHSSYNTDPGDNDFFKKTSKWTLFTIIHSTIGFQSDPGYHYSFKKPSKWTLVTFIGPICLEPNHSCFRRMHREAHVFANDALSTDS